MAEAKVIDRTAIVRRAAFIALVGNLFLAVLKIVTGLTAGSLAVLGDGLDSSTDVVIAVMTLAVGFIINQAWEDENARLRIRDMRVKTPSPHQAIANLSGGNQQKAILGRWLSEDMKVILLDEPTRGIDVGAKNEIYNVIYDLARSGIAVVVVSSELPEVLGISDRVMVMREGRVSGEFRHGEANEVNTLNLAMPARN